MSPGGESNVIHFPVKPLKRLATFVILRLGWTTLRRRCDWVDSPAPAAMMDGRLWLVTVEGRGSDGWSCHSIRVDLADSLADEAAAAV